MTYTFPMPRKKTNQEIARILLEFAAIDEAEGIPYKPQAYESAAKTVAELGEELSVLYKKCGRECIDDLPDIGESISKKIETLVTKGSLSEHQKLKKKYPFDIVGFSEIEGIGPKKALKLYQALKIKTVAQLAKAAKDGKVAKLKGFGERSQKLILEGISFLGERAGRSLLSDADRRAEHIIYQMRKIPGVTHFDVTGSLRRRQETIGDLDFIVTTTDEKKAREAFKHLPEVDRVFEDAPEHIFVHFKFGMDGDMLLLKPEEYGAALLHFTGNKEHNIQIRKLAIKKGWSLSEHGISKGKKILASKTEEEIYQKLGMQMMPPELRQGNGEVEAARKGNIPDVIGFDDLKGDLQVQTDWTDGEHSIEEMAKAAKAAGLQYIAITDHTKALAMTGLDEKELAKQGKEIDKLNKKLKNFRILRGAEVNVLKDGKLDISDAVLKNLDVVGISVHSYFHFSAAEQTKRIIAAMKNPRVHILFHPTGRHINERPAMELDMAKIIRAAKEFGVALEINADPARLDLKDAHIRMAVEAGAKLVVNSDAHHMDHFENLKYGIAQARRGWAKRSDVLNTLPLDAFLKKIKR